MQRIFLAKLTVCCKSIDREQHYRYYTSNEDGVTAAARGPAAGGKAPPHCQHVVREKGGRALPRQNGILRSALRLREPRRGCCCPARAQARLAPPPACDTTAAIPRAARSACCCCCCSQLCLPTRASSLCATLVAAAPSFAQEERARRHIGCRVLVDGVAEGVLSYFGKVGSKGEKRCGVALDQPVGKTDGSYKKTGKRYFECEPKHGVYVSLERVTIIEEGTKPRRNSSSGERPALGAKDAAGKRARKGSSTGKSKLSTSVNADGPASPASTRRVSAASPASTRRVSAAGRKKSSSGQGRKGAKPRRPQSVEIDNFFANLTGGDGADQAQQDYVNTAELAEAEAEAPASTNSSPEKAEAAFEIDAFFASLAARQPEVPMPVAAAAEPDAGVGAGAGTDAAAAEVGAAVEGSSNTAEAPDAAAEAADAPPVAAARMLSADNPFASPARGAESPMVAPKTKAPGSFKAKKVTAPNDPDRQDPPTKASPSKLKRDKSKRKTKKKKHAGEAVVEGSLC